MKQLEDLEQIKKQYANQLFQKGEQKKFQCIKDVVNDFSTFFSEKEFEVTKQRTRQKAITQATYGSLKAELSHGDPSSNYMGVQFSFDLDLTALKMSKMTVVLNRTTPGISSSITSGSSSKDSQLKQDISRTEQEIEDIKTRLDNFDSEKWKLFIKNENANSSYLFSEPYSSMYDLLTDLIK